MRMKTHFLRLCVAALLLAVLHFPARAQDVANQQKYRIDYVDEQRLMRNGSQLTMVDFSLEWPVRLCGHGLPRLQQWLCREMFGAEAFSLDAGRRHYLGKLGREIASMPEEEHLRVRYVSMVLAAIDWEPDKYMSFRLVVKERGDGEPQPTVTAHKMFTYDVVNDRVLEVGELIRSAIMREGYQHEDFLDIIEYVMPKIDGVVDGDSLPDQGCLLHSGVGMAFNLPVTGDSSNTDQLVVVPEKYITPFLTKTARQLIAGKKVKAPKKDKNAPLMVEEPPSDTLKVHEVVDVMPEFNGGVKALGQFLATHVTYPDYEQMLGIDGRVMVSFVVMSDGSVARPMVVLPVSPGLDRRAVEAVRDMPRWKPGTFNGQPVNVRVIVPVTFKMNRPQ